MAVFEREGVIGECGVGKNQGAGSRHLPVLEQTSKGNHRGRGVRVEVIVRTDEDVGYPFEKTPLAL